ncbi:MAG: PEP-utilizing enzyme [Actinomycetaceae bacterium]|nr:PEP-utilizing enzyme [Actinomycetaceae bacterium]
MGIVSKGVPVVSGVAYAPALWLRKPQFHDDTTNSNATDQTIDCAREVRRFTEAADQVAERFNERALQTVGSASDILTVSAAMATDPAWRKATIDLINTGVPATRATTTTLGEIARKFVASGTVLADRVTDLVDLRDRILAGLHGLPEMDLPQPDSPVVLLCDDLAPADTAALDPKMIQGLVCRHSGPTSHSAIIARQMGIPCIVSTQGLDNIEDGTLVLVNGTKGTVKVNPDPGHARSLVALEEARHEAASKWVGPAKTRDGIRTYLYANVQNRVGALQAKEVGAEGIGLLRTELAFIGHTMEPSIEAQARAYQNITDVFPDDRIIVRTLDAGSDKPVAWAGTQPEENPALGVRGLRTRGRRPEVLEHQLDALAIVNEGRNDPLNVMAPMVATLEEAAEFAEKVRTRGMVPGVMIEVPAIAFLAGPLLEIIDFVSLGTNDLTQYLMAADRTNPHVATYLDAWQPAVLAMINSVARAAGATGKRACVCGEAAADPVLGAVLLGMGVTGLSMAPSAIRTVGSFIGQINLETCKRAATAVLGASAGNNFAKYSGAFNASEARERALAVLADAGVEFGFSEGS